MDERRKIVIPIGSDPNPDSKSEQTYFDTQARKEARPVIPISGTSTTGPTPPGQRSRKWILLVVIIVAAIAVGGTAGVYAYMSRSRVQSGPQAAVQPVAGQTLSTLPWTHTPEDPAAADDADATESSNDNDGDETQAGNDRAANSGDSKKTNKQQKRGKSGNKNANDNTVDPVKRTQDELQRIREIFEGPP